MVSPPFYRQYKPNTYTVMPFIQIPFTFREEDDLSGKYKEYSAPLSINTSCIVSYNPSSDGECTIIRTTDGESVEIELDTESFEEILKGVENLVDIKDVFCN